MGSAASSSSVNHGSSSANTGAPTTHQLSYPAQSNPVPHSHVQGYNVPGNQPFYHVQPVHCIPMQPAQNTSPTNPTGPPIGFEPVMLRVAHGVSGPQTSTSVAASHSDPQQSQEGKEVWDEKRDIVFMRVLSADEYLGRMEETSNRVHTFSQASEKDLHRPKIQELMAIRGHLQDELLRIEAMLAADDPKQEYLVLYQQSYPRVVQALRDIRSRATMISKDVETATIQDRPVSSETSSTDESQGNQKDIPLKHNLLIPRFGPAFRQTAPKMNFSKPKQKDVKIDTTTAGGTAEDQTSIETDIMGVQTEGGNMTEEELQCLHKDEEEEVAEQYAKQLVPNTEQLSQAEIDRLLNDHLFTMQALRQKQSEERERLQNILESKKRERHKKRQQQDCDPSSQGLYDHPCLSDSEVNTKGHSDDTISSVTQPQVNSDVMLLENLSSTEDEATPLGTSESDNSDSDFEDGRFILRNVSSLKHSEDKCSDDFEDDEEQIGQTAAEQNANQRSFQQDLWSTFQLNGDAEQLKQKLADYREVQNQRNRVRMSGLMNMSDVSCDTEVITKHNAFVQTISDKSSNMTDADFDNLLKRHLAEMVKLRRLKNAEKQKHQGSLHQKLEDRKKHNRKGNEEESESEDLLSDKDIEIEMEYFDDQFRSDVVNKRRMMTTEELQTLLVQHERQRWLLQQKKQEEKNKLNDILQRKLEKKNNKKLKLLDEDFAIKVKQLRDNCELTEEEFTKMLESYLNSLESVYRRTRRKSRKKQINGSKEDVSKAASDLLQEHQQHTRHMHDLRQREKAAVDEKLHKKLLAKRLKQL